MGPTAPPDRLGPRRRANIAGKFARSVDIKKAPSNHDADAGSNRLVAAARRSAIPTLQGRHDELFVGLLPFLAQRRRQNEGFNGSRDLPFCFCHPDAFCAMGKTPRPKTGRNNSCRQSYNLWFMATMRWLRKASRRAVGHSVWIEPVCRAGARREWGGWGGARRRALKAAIMMGIGRRQIGERNLLLSAKPFDKCRPLLGTMAVVGQADWVLGAARHAVAIVRGAKMNRLVALKSARGAFFGRTKF